MPNSDNPITDEKIMAALFTVALTIADGLRGMAPSSSNAQTAICMARAIMTEEKQESNNGMARRHNKSQPA